MFEVYIVATIFVALVGLAYYHRTKQEPVKDIYSMTDNEWKRYRESKQLEMERRKLEAELRHKNKERARQREAEDSKRKLEKGATLVRIARHLLNALPV